MVARAALGSQAKSGEDRPCSRAVSESCVGRASGQAPTRLQRRGTTRKRIRQRYADREDAGLVLSIGRGRRHGGARSGHAGSAGQQDDGRPRRREEVAPRSGRRVLLRNRDPLSPLGRAAARRHASYPRPLCPWHKATFDARSGDLLDPPALDGIAAFRVRVDGDDVNVDRSEGPHRGRSKPMHPLRPRAGPARRRPHRRWRCRSGRSRGAPPAVLHRPHPDDRTGGAQALRPSQPEQGRSRRRTRGQMATAALGRVLRGAHDRAPRRARDRPRRRHANAHARRRRHGDAGRGPHRQRRPASTSRWSGPGRRRLRASSAAAACPRTSTSG